MFKNKKRQMVAIVLIGPCGVGRTTILNKLLSKLDNFVEPKSYQTRPLRLDNSDVRKIYISPKKYKARQSNGKFLLASKFGGNYYWVLKDTIKDLARNNRNIILDISLDNLHSCQDLFRYGYKLLTFYIMPPDIKTLAMHLWSRRRKTKETKKEIVFRLRKGAREIKNKEKHQNWKLIDFVITNDNFDQTISSIIKIIKKTKRHNQLTLKI